MSEKRYTVERMKIAETKKATWTHRRSEDIEQADDGWVLEGSDLTIQVCTFYTDGPYQVLRTGYDDEGHWAWVQDVGPGHRTLKAAMAHAEKERMNG